MSSGSQRSESYGASLPHFLQTYSRELSMVLHTCLRFVVSLFQKSHLMEPTSLLGWQRCPLPLACFLHLGHSNVFTYSVMGVSFRKALFFVAQGFSPDIKFSFVSNPRSDVSIRSAPYPKASGRLILRGQALKG